MQYLRKWLSAQTTSRVAFRPHRVVELPLPFDDAYARVRDTLVTGLGAVVYVDDPAARFLEAGFGLVNSERLRASFDVVSDERTDVRIDAIFTAGPTARTHSHALDVLADSLEASVRT